MKQVNDLIKELFSEDPFEYSKTDIATAEQVGALANAYGNKGFREYLQSRINESIFNSVIHSEKMEDILIRKGRILGLMMLLKVCRESWEKVTHEAVTKKIKQINKPESNIKEF